jgi:hypothetical protein
VKKADNSANFAAGGILSLRTDHTQLTMERQSQTSGDHFYSLFRL